MKTNIAAILTALCMTIVPLSAEAWVADEPVGEAYAMLRFDNGRKTNIVKTSSYEGTMVYDERDGVRVAKLRRDSGSSNFLGIDIEDGLFSADKPDIVFVTVRYYDEGHGYFALVYDDNDKDWSSEPCKMEDTHTWKEYTFALEDCIMRNSYRTNDDDFAIAVWNKKTDFVSADPVYIQWIKVEKGYPTHPEVTLTSDHVGNAFDGNDAKKMRLHIKNTYNVPIDLNLDCRILDYDNNFMEDNSSFSISLAPGETADRDITFSVSRYGCYLFEVGGECSAEWNGVPHTTKFDPALMNFSIMNKLTDKDTPNRMMKTNAHDNYAWTEPAIMSELYHEAGISGVRDEWRWGLIEQQSGVFNFEYEWNDNITKDFVPYDIEHGRDMMLILDYGNRLYMPGEKLNNHVFPDNDRFPGSEEGFLNYVEHITKRYGSSVKYYEFWNEANITAFNTYNVSAEKYAALLKKVYAIVKKNAPGSLVVGMSSAGVGENYHRAVLEAGGGEYMDMVSFHPYDWSGKFHGDTYKKYIEQVKNIYRQYGYDDMLFTADEMGITAWPESGKWPNEFGQAAQSVQYYAMSQAEELVDSYYIFHYSSGTSPAKLIVGGQEERWGMLKNFRDTVPYAAQPAVIATAAYNQMIGNGKGVHQYISDADNDGFRTYAYHFKREKDGKDVLVYWSEYGSAELGIKLGTDKAESFDMYSNSEGILHATDSVFSLTTSFEPRYLVGEFSDFEMTDAKIKTNGGRMTAIGNDTLTLTYSDASKRNLRADAAMEDGIVLQENEGISNGNGRLVCGIGDNLKNEERINVKLYDDKNNMVYDGLYHILEIDKPVSVSGIIDEANINANQRSTVSVTLTNITQGYTLNGDVVMDFTDEGRSRQTRRVVGLKSGQSAVLRFNLPFSHSQKVRELKLSYDFGGLEANTDTFTVTPSVKAAYAVTAPPINGGYNKDDWAGGTWFAGNDAYSAQYYGGWEGAKDAGFEGTILWDDKNLYLLTEVTDDKFYQPYEDSGFWQGDSIQLGIMKQDGSSTVEIGADLAGTSAFSGIGIYRDTKGNAKLYRYKTQYGSVAVDFAQNCAATVTRKDGKWIYRAAIPWSEIFGPNQKITEGELLRFGMLLNDNDGSGRNYTMFCDGIATSKRDNTFTTLTLVK